MLKRVLGIISLILIYVVTSAFIISFTYDKLSINKLVVIELLISGLTCLGILFGNKGDKGKEKDKTDLSKKN